jgi:hypothetical protein
MAANQTVAIDVAQETEMFLVRHMSVRNGQIQVVKINANRSAKCSIRICRGGRRHVPIRMLSVHSASHG